MQWPHAPARALALTMFATTIPLASSAKAQTYDPNYPVCLQIYDDMVHYYFDCSYTSMAQCAASASGRSAQCVINPYPAKAKAPRVKRQKREY